MPDTKRPALADARARSKTRPGYGSHDGGDDEPTAVNLPDLRDMAATVPRAGRPPSFAPAPPPPIEVEVIEEHGSTSLHRGAWRAIEIWTRNRVYSVDASMTCVEVLERATGRADPDHSFVGARLGGGQRKEGSRLKLSHPYPVPGTEAVFKLPAGRQGRFGQTSKVERVVLRMRVAQVSLLEAEPMWEEITGRMSIPADGPSRRGR